MIITRETLNLLSARSLIFCRSENTTGCKFTLKYKKHQRPHVRNQKPECFGAKSMTIFYVFVPYTACKLYWFSVDRDSFPLKRTTTKFN